MSQLTGKMNSPGLIEALKVKTEPGGERAVMYFVFSKQRSESVTVPSFIQIS